MPEEILEEGGSRQEAAPIERPETAEGNGVSIDERIELVDTGAPEQEGKYNEILTKVSQTAKDDTAAADITEDAKSIGATVDEESKIEKLLHLAETKGVVHAVKVARSLKDFYALDKMHDELADRLYAELVDRGMIEKE